MDANESAVGGWAAEVELRVPWWNRIIGSPWSCTDNVGVDENGFAYGVCTPRRWHPAYWLMRARRALGLEAKITTVYLGAPE